MNDTMNNDHSLQMYEIAKSVLIKEQDVSISLLQRRMKIGYTLALGLMSHLEKNEVVTGKNPMGVRTLTAKYSIKIDKFK